MDFLEKDLEEIIFYGERDELKNRGLDINGKVYRQLNIGSYGRADLVSFERSYEYEYIPTGEIDKKTGGWNFLEEKERKLVFTVYELKKDVIDIDTLLQAIGYCRGIKRYITDNRNFPFYVDFKIVLIGRKISLSSSFCYFEDLFKNIEFYTYQYKIDGIYFKKERGYKLSEEGFSLKLNNTSKQ